MSIKVDENLEIGNTGTSLKKLHEKTKSIDKRIVIIEPGKYYQIPFNTIVRFCRV